MPLRVYTWCAVLNCVFCALLCCAVACDVTGGNLTGTVMQCSTNLPMPAGAQWCVSLREINGTVCLIFHVCMRTHAPTNLCSTVAQLLRIASHMSAQSTGATPRLLECLPTECSSPANVLLCIRVYTYLVRGVTPGTLSNRAQVLYADSNPGNDNSSIPLPVYGTCGNPAGTGIRPECPPGSVYRGPDNLTLLSPAAFEMACCVSASTCSSTCRRLAWLASTLQHCAQNPPTDIDGPWSHDQ
jgi:hypothetical protein